MQEIEDGNAQNSYDHVPRSRSSWQNNDLVSCSNSESNLNGPTQGCNPSTFQLLKVKGLQNWANAGCVGIQDVIEVCIFLSYFVPLCFFPSGLFCVRHMPIKFITHLNFLGTWLYGFGDLLYILLHFYLQRIDLIWVLKII
jgi:hypothetical protein